MQLREKPCIGLPRRLRRFLLVLGIMQHCNLTHATPSYPIPVRITNRDLPKQKFQFPISFQSDRTNLIHLDYRHPHGRKKRGRKVKKCLPSVLLSNLRSISNKFDEVSLKIRDLLPDIAVFTES